MCLGMDELLDCTATFVLNEFNVTLKMGSASGRGCFETKDEKGTVDRCDTGDIGRTVVVNSETPTVATWVFKKHFILILFLRLFKF